MRMSRTSYEEAKARIHAKGYSKEQSRPDVASPHESQLFFLELAADEDVKHKGSVFKAEEELVDAVNKYCEELLES